MLMNLIDDDKLKIQRLLRQQPPTIDITEVAILDHASPF